MSGPSFENIDRWLFEYVEGNLSSEQEKQLNAFLLDHPEFDLDLDSWQMAKVEPVVYEFPNQEILHRDEKKRRRILPYVFGISIFTTLASVSILFLMKTSEKENTNKIDIGVSTFKNQNLAKNQRNDSNIDAKNQKKGPASIGISNVIYSNSNTEISSIQAESNVLLSEKSQPLVSSLKRGSQLTSMEYDNVQNEFSHTISDLHNAQPLDAVSENQITNDSLTTNEIAHENLVQLPTRDDQIKKVDQKKVTTNKSISADFSLKKIIKNLNKFMGDEIGLKNTRDHQIHMPGVSQLDANFSRAGDISSTRFRTFSRAQWLGKENQSFTNQMALDWFSKTLKSGFGIQGNYQLYGNGVIQNWNAAFIYSPKILLSKSLLIEPGIRYKMGSKILTSNLVNTINKVEVERDNTLDFYADGSIPIGTNQWFRDIGTSVLVHSKWFYIGAQADNLLRHQDNIYSNSISAPRRTGIHYSVNVGTEYVSKTGESSCSPYGFYEKFENREEAWGGFNFQYKAWSFGGALSNKSNFALSTGLRFATFAFTYQFDKTYSSLLGQSANSHQISIMFNTKVSRSARRYIQIK